MQRLALVGLLLAVASLGCSIPPPDVEGLAATRWIDGEPDDFDPSSLYTSVSRGSWLSATGSPSTVIERAAAHRRDGGWLYLTPIDNHAILVTEVEIDAAQVDVLRLDTSFDSVRSIFLYWAGPGESFSKDRQILVERRDGAATVFELEVGEHERWQGAITKLRWVLWSPAELGIRRLEAFERTLDRDRLREVVERPWKVAVDDDLRPARLVAPDAPLEHRIEVVEGSSLTFGYATHRRNEHDFELRLVGETEGDPAVLFNAPFGTAAASWREADVDLSAFAGQTVDLRFEVDRIEGFGETTGLPLIAHPTLLRPTDSEPPPNVVLIVVDTLRPDRLSLYGYERPTSPHLDAWAERRGAVFTRAVSQAGWTLPAHASLFSGLDPQRHGLVDEEPMPAGLATLTTELARRGYATWATTGGAYLDYHYGFDRGFDVYRTWRDSTRKDDEPVEGVEQTLAAIERLRDRPFFLFFHTYAVHGPYKAWQPHFSAMSDLPDDVEVQVYAAGGENGTRRHQVRRLVEGRGEPVPDALKGLPSDQYDSGIARLDQLLGPLFDVLDDPELARRTIVVVTSDHGEMFGEHGYYDHGYLWDQNLLVPLIVADPRGRGAGARIDRQVRLTDIAPTILELTGSPALADVDGTSLVPLLEGRDEPPPQIAWSYGARSEHGLSARYRDRYKLIVHDTAWEPFRGREQVWRVDTPDGVERRLDTLPEALAGLGDLARRQLAETLPGLRLLIENPSDRELRGSISGRAVMNRQTLKTPLRGCGCLEWQRPGLVSLRVPPGDELLLVMTSFPAPELRLVLEVEGLPTFDGAIDVPAVAESLAIEQVDGEWRQVLGLAGRPAETTDHPTAKLWWHEPSGSTQSVAEDSEVREQLRALGYVDG